MSERQADPAVAAWADALLALRAVVADPLGLGVVLRAGAGPVRERWLALLRAALPVPITRLPAAANAASLLGGIDLAASLAAGQRRVRGGALARADGAVAVLPMAERCDPEVAGLLARALDEGRIAIERDGVSAVLPARFGLVALDEGEEERAPEALADRLAFHLDLTSIPWGVAAQDVTIAPATPAAGGEAEPLVATAAALGIASLRAPLLALRAARALAGARGAAIVAEEDLAAAARLVLAPRATVLPQTEQAPPEPPPPPNESEPNETERDKPADSRSLEEIVLEAALAAVPDDLLERLGTMRSRAARGGVSGAWRRGGLRGRPLPPRAGLPGPEARLDIIETLRAAAPWQKLRGAAGRVVVRREDFRTRRFRARSASLAIFAVDASGSSAMGRLAEAKGAVEILLAQSYARRDEVAMIAFRGAGAEVLLEPTRALARARRGLAGLPGGGATPLAAALDAAVLLAERARGHGRSPSLVLLTDCRANVARDASQGRGPGEADARIAARALRATGLPAVLLDTAPRPGAFAREMAGLMGARYVPLPFADAATVARAARIATVR
jgi:magnesium chelatase subunit D